MINALTIVFSKFASDISSITFHKLDNIAIFASGNGTNCENIIRHYANSNKARVVLVVCNKKDAPVVKRSEALGVPVKLISAQELRNKESILPLLEEKKIDLIVLAGFLLMIPHYLIEAYNHRIVNIHPALLPKYGGKGMYGHHVHEAVFAAKEKETGLTVHYVSDKCDGGEIIAQRRVSLLPTDTPDTIAQKEHELEMREFPLILDKIVDNL